MDSELAVISKGYSVGTRLLSSNVSRMTSSNYHDAVSSHTFQVPAGEEVISRLQVLAAEIKDDSIGFEVPPFI